MLNADMMMAIALPVQGWIPLPVESGQRGGVPDVCLRTGEEGAAHDAELFTQNAELFTQNAEYRKKQE